MVHCTATTINPPTQSPRHSWIVPKRHNELYIAVHTTLPFLLPAPEETLTIPKQQACKILAGATWLQDDAKNNPQPATAHSVQLDHQLCSVTAELHCPQPCTRHADELTSPHMASEDMTLQQNHDKAKHKQGKKYSKYKAE